MKTLLLILPLLSLGNVDQEYLKITRVTPTSLRINGKAGQIAVTATVKSGFHVQANPASQPNLVPTTFLIEPNDAFEIGTVQYPEGKAYRRQNSEQDLLTYEGTFEIKVPVKVVSAKVKRGKNLINAKLRYQACDNKNCFFPTTVKLTIPVTVNK